jgi:hypothetical protein
MIVSLLAINTISFAYVAVFHSNTWAAALAMGQWVWLFWLCRKGKFI